MSAKQKITILNSRQGLYPCRLHIWIQQSLKALNSIKESKPVIISSTGMSTWDILTVTASILQLELELHVQIKKNISEENTIKHIISDYNLNPLLVRFVSITENSKKEFQRIRDISITTQADKIFPISIRPNGNLDSLIAQNKNKVDTTYKTTYVKRNENFTYTLEDCNLKTEIQNISYDYIIHWTKTSKSKWHHESQYDFYKDLLNSDKYPRSAIDSLVNIIKLKRIIATPTHMPQNTPTVSFTSLSPIAMIPLFKWRSRHQQMSFEPYGIGIKKSIAYNKDILKVRYYEKDNSDSSIKENSYTWLNQSKGVNANWELENEYRHLGDFHLKDLDKKDIILFTRFKKEADMLQEQTGFKTISFLS